MLPTGEKATAPVPFSTRKGRTKPRKTTRTILRTSGQPTPLLTATTTPTTARTKTTLKDGRPFRTKPIPTKTPQASRFKRVLPPYVRRLRREVSACPMSASLLGPPLGPNTCAGPNAARCTAHTQTGTTAAISQLAETKKTSIAKSITRTPTALPLVTAA